MKHGPKPGNFPWDRCMNPVGTFPGQVLVCLPVKVIFRKETILIFIRGVNNHILLYTNEIVNHPRLKNTDFPAAGTGTILPGVPECIPVPAVPT